MPAALWLSLCLSAAAPSDGAAVAAVGMQQLRIKNYRPMGLNYQEVILLRVALEGPAVKEALRYGNVVVTEAKDEAGNDLRITAGSAGSVTNKPAQYPLGKPEKTAGAVVFDLRLKPPAAGAKSYSVKGTLELHAIEGRLNADFPKIKPGEAQELAHADLAAAGLKARVVKPTAAADEKTIVLHIEGDENKLDGIELLDGGKVFKPASVKFLKGAKDDAAKDRYVQFAEKIGPDATLRLVLFKGLKVRSVPFEFGKLETP